ncbi:MAG: hypothetical protein R3F35_24530 [Myxococcota bacterium]
MLLALLGQVGLPDPARAMAQRTGDFEIEMDAPWRMEPRGASHPYGPIPIQLSIHDADQPKTADDGRLQQIISVMQGFPAVQVVLHFLEGPIDALLGPVDEILAWFGIDVVPHGALPPIVLLDRFDSLGIDEEVDGQFVRRQTVTLANVHEVEQTIGLWRHDPAQWGPEAGATPPTRPVHSICRRWQGQDCTGYARLRRTSEWHLTAMYTPSTATPGRDVRLRTVLRVRTVQNGVAAIKTYQRFLTVHLGEEPLPRFDSEWAYGDLHYHSQGTDNDGESGYAYRGTVQAMAALGLDFVFATDHASNSPQIGSARPIFSDELVQPITRGLRDLSPDRFAFGIDLLNGATGANREVITVARSTGRVGELVAPQLFLGSEVDVAPETIHGETSSYFFCYKVPDFLKALDQQTFFPDSAWCDSMSDPQPDGRELLFDVQGPAGGNLLSTRFYARQHLLHLPVDGQRKSAFIASNTSKYGGGTRRLGEILDVELGARQKGYAFLAHPFAQGSGEGVGSLGPDLISYTSAQLDDALASPYVLGLQIWNEDSLVSAKADDAHPFPAPDWEEQHQPFRFRDFQKWDIVQLKGLDKARTDRIAWLGGKPRRVFAAGGSDAHGDFNYRREGYFFGTEKVTGTAIGKPRNLVHVGPAEGAPLSNSHGTARPVSQRQVVEGLRSGNFAITDGPAVRLMIDVNENGVIDAPDLPMGSVYRQLYEKPLQVIVEWKSSPEFAPVAEIDLLVGVWAEELVDGMVYTRNYEGPIANEKNSFVQPGTGKVFVTTPNIPYWYDPNPANPLFIAPTPAEAYGGQRVVRIDPALYPVGQGVCVLSETTQAKQTSTSTTSSKTGTSLLGTTSLRLATSSTLDASAATRVSDGGTTTGTTDTVVYLRKPLNKTLDDLINGIIDEPPPTCLRREFQKAARPDRLFVRAEVRNLPAPDSNGFCAYAPLPDSPLPQCVSRMAYSNPVWIEVDPCTSPIDCLIATTSVDLSNGLLDAGSDDGGSSEPDTGLTDVAVDLTLGVLDAGTGDAGSGGSGSGSGTTTVEPGATTLGLDATTGTLTTKTDTTSPTTTTTTTTTSSSTTTTTKATSTFSSASSLFR